MAAQYDKLFLDWQSAAKEEAEILSRLFTECGYDRTAQILDCACGTGTQALGLATLEYQMIASDISTGELAKTRKISDENAAYIHFDYHQVINLQ